MARPSKLPKRHPAEAGDLICGPALDGSGWQVLRVDTVDDDGFVAVVADADGYRAAISRVFETSTPERPHLIVGALQLQLHGLVEMVGMSADDLEPIKVELRRWKADA